MMNITHCFELLYTVCKNDSLLLLPEGGAAVRYHQDEMEQSGISFYFKSPSN